jgi:hypothetical protein
MQTSLSSSPIQDTLTYDILRKGFKCCSDRALTIFCFFLTLAAAIVIFATGVTFYTQGGKEASLWLSHRNFAAPSGIKMDQFCGNFQKWLGITALWSNLLPTSLSWLLIVGGVLYLCCQRESLLKITDVVWVAYAIQFLWSLIVKAVSVGNYQTTDQTCLDFWRSVGLQSYLDLFEAETKLLILCAVCSGGLLLFIIFGMSYICQCCKWCCEECGRD